MNVRFAATLALAAALAGTITYLALSPEHDETSSVVEIMDDPLWYRSLDGEARLQAAEKRLAIMTATTHEAKEAGPIKDEIALLCRDENVVDVVVRAFEERHRLSLAELSSFLEIFARVRHSKFAPLVKKGINESRPEAKLNALEAAITQRSAVLLDDLVRALPSSNEYQSRRIIDALARIGTEAAWNEISELMSAESSTIAITALTIVAEGRMTQAVPAILELLPGASGVKRVMIGYALAKLGQSAGFDVLAEMASDKSLEDRLRAQAVQNLSLLQSTRHDELYTRLMKEAGDFTRLEARTAAVRRGNPEARELTRAETESTDSLTRRNAMVVLGQAGAAEDIEWVASRIARFDDDDVTSFLKGLEYLHPVAAVSFLEGLARGKRLKVEAMRALVYYGSAGLDAFERLLAERPEGQTFVDVVIGIAAFKNERALRILETCLDRKDRREWRFVRDLVRLTEQEVLKVGHES